VTIVALTSAKGAPGLTTLALALTTALTTDPNLFISLIEADPAGGDVAPSLGLPMTPGMVSFAAASRHKGVRPDPAAHAQALPCGGWVVVGSTDPMQAAASVATVAGRLAEALSHVAHHAVIDCGRWSPSSPAAPILAAADRTLVLIRPTLSGIEHLRTRLVSLSELTGRDLGVVLAGSGPYTPVEVEAATGLYVHGVMPIDSRGREAVRGRTSGRTARRTPLVRMARSLADHLEELRGEAPGSSSPPKIASPARSR
jgi:hypothetical protein